MGQTLVFYMGVYNLEKITSTLLENGMDGETPAALIQEGTLPQQQVVISTIDKLAQQVCTKELKPGVVIVGDTVRFADYLKLH
jgi:siroheme synthase